MPPPFCTTTEPAVVETCLRLRTHRRGGRPIRSTIEPLGVVVKFHWEAIAGDGEVAVGLDFLVLAADGRIERDYTFVVG